MSSGQCDLLGVTNSPPWLAQQSVGLASKPQSSLAYLLTCWQRLECLQRNLVDSLPFPHSQKELAVQAFLKSYKTVPGSEYIYENLEVVFFLQERELNYSSPLLSTRHAFHNPQWVPKTLGSISPCCHHLEHISVHNFHPQI